jgi:hypothetical protein
MSQTPPRTEPELVEHVRAIDEPAPEALHRRVQVLVSEQERARRRGPAIALPMLASNAVRAALAATALAAVAVVLVLALAGGGGANGGGGSGRGGGSDQGGVSRVPSPSLRQTAALTLRPANAAPPQSLPGNRAVLAADVEGVAFPSWDARVLGSWHAVGARRDRLNGRTAVTIFYANDRGQRIGYTILAGLAPAFGGGAVTWRGSTSYRLTGVDGVQVLTWRRDGRLCVLSGRGVDSATLLALASWGEPS